MASSAWYTQCWARHWKHRAFPHPPSLLIIHSKWRPSSGDGRGGSCATSLCILFLMTSAANIPFCSWSWLSSAKICWQRLKRPIIHQGGTLSILFWKSFWAFFSPWNILIRLYTCKKIEYLGLLNGSSYFRYCSLSCHSIPVNWELWFQVDYKTSRSDGVLKTDYYLLSYDNWDAVPNSAFPTVHWHPWECIIKGGTRSLGWTTGGN